VRLTEFEPRQIAAIRKKLDNDIRPHRLGDHSSLRFQQIRGSTQQATNDLSVRRFLHLSRRRLDCKYNEGLS
jgi:hypothetical protein